MKLIDLIEWEFTEPVKDKLCEHGKEALMSRKTFVLIRIPDSCYGYILGS